MRFDKIMLEIAMGLAAMTVTFIVCILLSALFSGGLVEGLINSGYVAVLALVCWGVGALISRFI